MHQTELFKTPIPSTNPGVPINDELNQTVPSRSLKIEADGDPWRGRIKPKIRLKGHWLASAGFKPGQRTEVKFVAHGVIELRSNASAVDIQSTPQ